jgi:hypothetical protein
MTPEAPSSALNAHVVEEAKLVNGYTEVSPNLNPQTYSRVRRVRDVARVPRM